VPHREVEDLWVDVNASFGDSMRAERMNLKELNLDRIQLIADVMAKSIVLQHYETEIASSFDLIEPLASDLEKGVRNKRRVRDILKHLGAILLSEHKMVGRVEVVEKPDSVWDHPSLEKLYLWLEDEFEIRERHKALERKIDLVSRTAQTVIDLVQTQRGHRLEWYIIALIAVEIAIYLYQMFFR
jgi:uncharacterized Rmd1/YagE family protein